MDWAPLLHGKVWVTNIAIQWALVVFKLLAGAGAGIIGFVGIAELFGSRAEPSRKALIAGIVLLVIGGCAALLQVGKPAGIMSVVSNLKLESPISWELVSYGIAVIVGVVYLALAKSKNALIKPVAIIAIIVAVAVGFTSGYSHMSLTGMRSWHNAAIPASFLFSALSLGSLGYLALSKKAEDEKGFGLITIAAIALGALATVSYIAYGVTANLGEYQVMYWALAPILGGAASTFASFMLRTKDSAVWLYAGLACALIGAATFRAIIWAVIETGLRTGNSVIHL